MTKLKWYDIVVVGIMYGVIYYGFHRYFPKEFADATCYGFLAIGIAASNYRAARLERYLIK